MLQSDTVVRSVHDLCLGRAAVEYAIRGRRWLFRVTRL
jgi:hypothetical protein